MSSAEQACVAIPHIFDYYDPPSDRFDECLGATGCLRGPWPDFFQRLGADPLAALRNASAACHRAIIEQEVNMNVYAGSRSSAQPWPLDVLPLLLDSGSWNTLEAGLKQRANLYNLLLQDLYGSQQLLKHGAIPAALAMGNPNFLRACAGRPKSDRPFLQTIAADVARSPDGSWWVLEDRLDAPAGLGYTLQNRIIIRHVLANAFRGMPVARLYQFFHDYRSSLRSLSTDGSDLRTVLLTPGPANEAFFEHTYLARYLGYPPVEGEDLTTRNGNVYLRTVGGMKPVDVIIRRVDSDFCDPLELNRESLIGIPGLVEASRAGKVALGNELGGRALEGTGMLAFLPALCRQVLGEELRVPSAATWWCGHEGPRDYVLENLSSLVIKPTFGRNSGGGTRYGARMTSTERDSLAKEIRSKPQAYCGQERVLLGTTPSWEKDRLRPMPYVMRVYLCWHEGEYRVMPGGLTRFNAKGEDGIVSLQQGSISKDTWIIQEEIPLENPIVTLLDNRGLAVAATSTPSRLADNLYWLGRYLERTAQIGRVLEKIELLREEEIASLDTSSTEDAVRLALRLQDTFAPVGETTEKMLQSLQDISTNPEHHGSLASNLRELSRILEIAKIHFPPDAWHSARRLRTLAGSNKITSVLRKLRTDLGGLEILVAETLPRDTGWRFLDLGRRIERAMQLLYCVQAFLPPWHAAEPTEFRLQTLLHLTDGLFTYRAFYQSIYQNGPVLACLLGALENPRSVCFQTNRILEHVLHLPEEIDPTAVRAVRAAAEELANEVRLIDTTKLAGESDTINAQATAWIESLAKINDRISSIYLSHLQATD